MLDATAPPFDPVDLEPALRPFGQSRMRRGTPMCRRGCSRSSRSGSSPSWTCVGREGDLEGTGAQRAVRVGGAGALLVRGTDGRVRAFANTCRHRGHELLGVGGQTTRRTVLCPYHAWTYDLDGSMRAAPGSATTATSAGPSTGWPSCRWRAGTGSCSSTAPATPRRSPSTSGPRRPGRPYQPERLIPWSATPTTWPATGRWCSRTTTSATTARSSTPSCARSARRPAATTSSWTAPGSAAPWTSRTTRPPCRWTATATACPSPAWTPSGCAPSPTSGCSPTCCSACTPTT